MALKVLSQGQGVYDDQIAKLFGLPLDKVRVILVSPTAAASAAKKTCRCRGIAVVIAPRRGGLVKVTLTRDESITMHPKRHPIWMPDHTVGCDARGKLTWRQGQVRRRTRGLCPCGHEGAGALGRPVATGAYRAGARRRGSGLPTPTISLWSHVRGFGTPPGHFRLELPR